MKTEGLVMGTARRAKSNVSNEKDDPCSIGPSKTVKKETSVTNGAEKRHRSKRRKTEVVESAVSKVRKRVRYFFMRMKQEQNLIDAYSSEGWKGQSREKVKPERELLRAKTEILKCKLRVREALQELEKMGLEGSIRDTAFDAEGELGYEEIFCAKCHSHDAEVNNDIILCDGACNRGFHQQCLDPPLATDDIPPGDEGWLCPVCDCKADCLESVNEYLGTELEIEVSWQKIFPEADPENAIKFNAGENLPSDESDDDDYNPETKEQDKQQDEIKEESNLKEANGDDDEEEDEDASYSGDSDAESESLVSEDLAASDADDDGDLSTEEIEKGKHEKVQETKEEEKVGNGDMRNGGSDDDVISDAEGSNEGLIVQGKRQRKEVDYKKLHDHMFGKDVEGGGEGDEDEEWGPIKRQKREKMDDVGDDDLEDVKCKRIPLKTVERLREVFAENQLPSRSYKEHLSKEIGLSYRKVDIWFKNIRYQALKNGMIKPTRVCPWKKKKTMMMMTLEKKKMKTKNGNDDSLSAVESSSPLPVVAAAAAAPSSAEEALLVELGRVQSKLDELKKTIEEAKTGKRILYIPVAEVVETHNP